MSHRSDKEVIEYYDDVEKEKLLSPEERNRARVLKFGEGADVPITKEMMPYVMGCGNRKTESPNPCTGNLQETDVYTVRGLVELANLELPCLECIWNKITLVPGSVVEIIGSPGIGKSRFVCDLARHQILGRDFCGLPTLKTPKRWLFAGTENGVHRLNRESCAYLYHREPESILGMADTERAALAVTNGFTATDLCLLDECFKAFTLENPSDYDLSLLAEDNVARLTKTLQAYRPDVLVLDPWGDVIAGDELKDGDIRATIRIVRNCLADSGLGKTLVMIVNHARIGAKEEANAKGTEAGNFGKNSKCLYSIARYVLNIRRASFDENPPIEVICAKNNDGRKPPSFAAELATTSMSYVLMENFDADAWQAALDGSAKTKTKCTEQAKQDKAGIFNAAVSVIVESGDELIKYTDLVNAVCSQGYGKTAVETVLAEAVKNKTLCTTRKRKYGAKGRIVNDGNSVVYGTPELIRMYRERWESPEI